MSVSEREHPKWRHAAVAVAWDRKAASQNEEEDQVYKHSQGNLHGECILKTGFS